MPKVTVSKVKHRPTTPYRVRYVEGGKRKDKFFKVKTGEGGADQWAKDKLAEQAKLGTAEGPITREERRAVMTFRDAVEEMTGDRPSLTDAVGHFLGHLSITNKPMLCSDVADSLIDRLEKEGKSKRHIDSTRNRMVRFNAEYGDRMAGDINTEIVDDFITHLGVASVTMLNYRLALSSMFAHAIRLKAASENPVADAMRPKALKKEPGILTNQQLVAMLAAATDRYLPALAISFFSGIRASEIEDLKWENIDFDEMHIEIKTTVAKRDMRRFVPISDNLRAWILPHRKNQGLVIQSPQIHRTERERATAIAGIDWPANAGRHSYASYHLAAFNDVGKTAFNMGKKNPTDVYADYRALVKPKDAATYWSIRPEAVDNVTSIKVG